MICDLHTHTNYCDGVNTPKEMLLSAIEKGLKTYGFSSHSYLPFDPSWNMSPTDEKAYVAEVKALREEYKDKIEVLLGTEFDLCSNVDLSGYDYVIGSCHNVIKGGEYLSVDHSEEVYLNIVNTYYEGDHYAFVKDYFLAFKQAAEIEEITFFGHFDLINKFNGGFKYFDETDPRYVKPMLSALEKLAKTGKPFELNTAHTFRHNKDKASASSVCWLTALLKMGGKVVVNSDAHSKDRIAYNFDKAEKLLKDSGFSSVLTLSKNGFSEYKL